MKNLIMKRTKKFASKIAIFTSKTQEKNLQKASRFPKKIPGDFGAEFHGDPRGFRSDGESGSNTNWDALKNWSNIGHNDPRIAEKLFLWGIREGHPWITKEKQ